MGRNFVAQKLDHLIIVQHEVSHNFDVDDQNSLLHPECIMNYVYAQQGTNIWCTSCRNTVVME